MWFHSLVGFGSEVYSRLFLRRRSKFLQQKSQVKHGKAVLFAILSTIGIYIVLETYLYTSSTQSRAGLFHSGGVGGCDSQGCSIAYKAVLRNWLHSNRRVYWASRRLWHSSLLCDASNILGTSFGVTTSDIIQFEDFCGIHLFASLIFGCEFSRGLGV